MKFNEWFPKMRRLELFSNHLDPTCIEASFPHLKYLSTEIVHGRDSDIGVDNIGAAVRLNPRLRALNIRIVSVQRRFLFGDFIKIIGKNPHITNLRTHWSYEHTFQNSVDPLKIAAALPSLTELHLTGFVLSGHEAISFFDQIKSLKKFSFALSNETKYQWLRNNSEYSWKVSKNKDQLTILER